MSRRRRRWWRLLVRAGLLGVGAVAVFAGIQWWTWPAVAELARTDPTTSAFIERHRRSQRRVGLSGEVAWRWVPYHRISPHLKRAVLVSEDINFFSHDGFELPELEQAVRDAVRERRPPRGASTLTQQLAKNLWLSPSRNPWRKVKEALLTRQLEAHLDKRRIFELYLNLVELGPGIYGAEAAARHYFAKAAADLDEREAAMLAASLPRPTTWNPTSASRTYQRRVERILARLDRAQWLWKVI